MLSVSVIINTVNRGNYLKDTLNALKYQRINNFEVIVVNGPSTDNTEEILEAWEGKIKIGKCNINNLSVSRNIGLKLAGGDIVAYLDDDAVPDPQWLTDLIEPFKETEIAAVGGKVLDINCWGASFLYGHFNRLGRWIGSMTQPTSYFFFPNSFEAPYPQGCNMAFRRELLIALGGFDENFAYLLEEPDVCCRLMDKGYNFLQLNKAIVHHVKAGSNIRRAGIFTDFYNIFKSKIYFSYKYGRKFLSEEEIVFDNEDYITSHMVITKNNYNKGLITREELDRVKEDAQRALEDGKKAAKSPPKYIDQKPGELTPPFLPFPTFSKENPLTLVFLCEEYPPRLNGGNARHTHDKAHSLAARGHEVHVVCQGETAKSITYEDGVWVHRIPVTGKKIPEEFAYLNIPQCLWNQSSSFKEEIDRIAETRTIDIIEAPIWNLTNLAALLDNKYNVLTCLVTSLGLSYKMHPEMIEDKHFYESFVKPVIQLENHVLKNSTHLISISNGIARDLLTCLDDKRVLENVSNSPLGIEDWSDKRFILPKTDNKIRILFVGRLEKRKGIDIFLKAIELIPDFYNSIIIDIIGDYNIPWHNGKNARELFQQKYESIPNLNIKFHGKVSEEDLHVFYTNCDLFVSPSLYESFGLVNVEAMLCGKAIISSNVGGIPEVVEENVNCLLVPPADPEALAKALSTLIANPSLIKNMGLESRQIYEKKFSLEITAKKAEEVYYRVLDNEKGSIKSPRLSPLQ